MTSYVSDRHHAYTGWPRQIHFRCRWASTAGHRRALHPTHTVDMVTLLTAMVACDLSAN